MSLSITALVIGGSSEHLDETLFGLSAQTRKANHVLVGCTDASEEEIARKHNFPFISITGTFPEKLEALVSAVERPEWFWVLFSDSCPDPQALENVARTAETSPSASCVAPKLVSWDHPSYFVSFGKTISQLGESFELVDSEIDQGQHDLLRDVLSADFAGMLIKAEAISGIRGYSAPMSAQSTVFGIRQWLAGNRVLVEPSAKVRVSDSQLINGERNIFGAHFANRFADYHLSLVTLPRVLALFYWLVIPLVSLFRSLKLVGSRRVRFFFSELGAGAGAFLSVANHLQGASELRKAGRLSSIGQLRADRARIRDRARRRFSELPPSEYRPGLLSGPWAWLIPLLLLANYRLFPSAEAVFGGNFAPLNANWVEMAANGWRVVDGYPVDSLVFPVALITLFGFWAPSAALGLFLFLVPALAFAGAWISLDRLSDNKLLVTLLSFAFALSPIYSLQVIEPDISSAIGYAFIGFFIHSMIMTIQSTVSSRAWRWTAWASLLLGMIAASTPYIFPVLLFALLVLAIFNRKRIGFVLFVPALSFVLLWPQLATWVSNPLSIFAPMGREFAYSNNWLPELVFILPLAALFITAFISTVINPKPLGVILLVASAFSFAGFAFVEHIQFVRAEGLSDAAHANGSLVLLLGVLALMVAIVVSAQKLSSVIASIISIGFALTGGYLQLTVDSGNSWGEYRQVPAIVEVESQRFELNTLLISESGQLVSLRPGNGMNLTEYSVLASLLAEQDSAEDEAIASLSASLIASNSVGIEELLNQFSVAFIQLEGFNPSLSSQLSRLPELTFAGQTDSGALWRVDSTSLSEKRITVNPAQLLPWLAIAVTTLVAIPTPASIRGRARIRGGR